MELLKELCQIHAPSGEEFRVRDFIIDYVKRNSDQWVQKPQLYYGSGYQDCLMLVFGEPRCGVMAHMDSVGFTAGYGNELIPIGSPAAGETAIIRNELNHTAGVYYDNLDKKWVLKDDLQLKPGSTWTWMPDFSIQDQMVQSPFLDNRLSIFMLLELAHQLKDTVVAFSTYEEMSNAGKAGFLAKTMYEQWQIDKILIADITWVTDYVKAGRGAAISLRDVGIPRKVFRDKIVDMVKASGVPYQLEIEKAGGSDGTIIGASDYPVDWIFIGAPEINPHGAIEKVHQADIESMMHIYKYLCNRL